MTLMSTVGVIARQTGATIHQVNHVIASRHIEAVGRAGNAWVYSDEAVAKIGRELAAIRQRRGEPAALACSRVGGPDR